MKAGKAFVTVDPKCTTLPPVPLGSDKSNAGTVLSLSTDGRAVAFRLDEVKELPRGKGVALMGLADDHAVADITVLPNPLDKPVVLVKPGQDTPLGQVKWADIEPLLAGRSASKKGKALHKKSAGAVFLRAGRETWSPAQGPVDA